MKKTFLFVIILVSFAFPIKQLNSQTIGWKELDFVPTYELSGVYCINYDTVVAVGANGYIIRTTDSGINWDSIPSNTTNHLYKVHFVNQTIGYAVGKNGTILKTSDMGQNWTNIGINTNLDFFSLSFINKDTGWVAGGEGDLYMPYGTKGILLKTTDGGTNWLVDSTYDKTISSVFFVDNDTGYICINNFPLSILRKTNNSGSSFYTIRYDSLSVNYYYTDVYFINPRIGYFVSSATPDYDKDGIYKTIDYGNTWNKIITQWSIKTMYILDSCILYLSYSDMPGEGSFAKNICTSDSIIGPNQLIFNFSFINIDSGFAVGNKYNSCNGIIYRRGLLTNINEKKKQKIEIYPNPFKDKIIVDFFNINIDISQINLIIYNSIGQKIFNKSNLKNNKFIIDLSEKPKGLYYLIINDNNKIIQTKKLIKF